MATANIFLDLLARKDLLDPTLIDAMRTRVAQSLEPVPAEKVASHLIEKGLLSQALADRLIQQAISEAEKKVSIDGGPLLSGSSVTEESELGLVPVDESELGLVPLDDKKSAPMPTAAPLPQAKPLPTAAPLPQAKPLPTAAPLPQAKPMPTAAPLPQAKPMPMAAPLPQAVPTAAPLPQNAPMPQAMPNEIGSFGTTMEAPSRTPIYKGRKQRRENVWDSKFLMLGSGALILLVLLMSVLLWRIMSRSADEMLADADQDYRDGVYSQAISKYEDYLEAFPSDAHVGQARVRLALCKIRQASESGGDWAKALETASAEIQTMSGEEEFKTEARPELNGLLPDIAEGLVDEAYEKGDPDLAVATENALMLVERYVLPQDRPASRLNDIRAKLELTFHEISRSSRLEDTIEAMGEVIDVNSSRFDPGEAYVLRSELLQEYPELRWCHLPDLPDYRTS